MGQCWCVAISSGHSTGAATRDAHSESQQKSSLSVEDAVARWSEDVITIEVTYFEADGLTNVGCQAGDLHRTGQNSGSA
jgi:hypothetical protein